MIDWIGVAEIVDTEHLEAGPGIGSVGATHEFRIGKQGLHAFHHLLTLLFGAVFIVVAKRHQRLRLINSRF